MKKVDPQITLQRFLSINPLMILLILQINILLIAKSTIQEEEAKEHELSKEKEDLESEINTKLDFLLKSPKRENNLAECSYHQILGEDLGTAVKKIRNLEEKKDLTLLKILRNLCHQCLYVKHSRYNTDVLSKDSLSSYTTTLSIKSKSSQIQKSKANFVPVSSYEAFSTQPKTDNQYNIADGKVVLNQNQIAAIHISLVDTAFTSTKKTSIATTTPYPVINVDAALNGDDDEEDEVKQKFQTILFYDQAECGINIDDVI